MPKQQINIEKFQCQIVFFLNAKFMKSGIEKCQLATLLTGPVSFVRVAQKHARKRVQIFLAICDPLRSELCERRRRLKRDARMASQPISLA